MILKNKGKMTKDTLNANAVAFLNTVLSKGYTPILYANRYYLTTYFNVDTIKSKVNKCMIWLAEYNSKAKYQGEYDIWQYTSSGSVDGINGDVDMDIVYF